MIRHRAGWPRLWLLFLATLLAAGCGETPSAPPQAQPELTLLALGDSYTVGEAVAEEDSWPRQLADSLATAGDTLQSLDLVARTGWKTGDLLDTLRRERAAGGLQLRPYGLVTLMIGVNNQFQGVDLALFQTEMDTLIDLAVQLAEGQSQRVLGFSIPDYGVTPMGSLFDPERISAEIQAHNQILEQKYSAAGITMLDITTVSLAAADDPRLVARDGLHYSREMYRRWVSLMLPEVRHGLGLEP